MNAASGLGVDPALCTSLSSHFLTLVRNRRYGRALADMTSFLGAEGRFSRLYFNTRWRLLFKGKASHARFPSWLNPDLEKRLGIRDHWNEIENPKPVLDAVRPIAYESMADSYWTTVVESYDPGVTRAPVEVRHPFFDLRLLKYLLGLSALPMCSDKELLRRAARGVLPETVRLRRKSPLLADPLLALLQKPESAWVDGFTPSKGLKGFVMRDRIPSVFREKDTWRPWINLRPLSLNYWLQRFKRMG